jgi:hypothetical protein
MNDMFMIAEAECATDDVVATVLRSRLADPLFTICHKSTLLLSIDP